MLTPTEAEIKLAKSLNIDPRGMTGPQVREAIEKARRPTVTARPSIRSLRRYREYIYVADLLGVEVCETDGIDTIKNNVVTKISERLDRKGVVKGVTIGFEAAHSHGGKALLVNSTEVKWVCKRPMISVRITTRRGNMLIGAESVALHAYVVGDRPHMRPVFLWMKYIATLAFLRCD